MARSCWFATARSWASCGCQPPRPGQRSASSCRHATRPARSNRPWRASLRRTIRDSRSCWSTTARPTIRVRSSSASQRQIRGSRRSTCASFPQDGSVRSMRSSVGSSACAVIWSSSPMPTSTSRRERSGVQSPGRKLGVSTTWPCWRRSDTARSWSASASPPRSAASSRWRDRGRRWIRVPRGRSAPAPSISFGARRSSARPASSGYESRSPTTSGSGS